MGMAPVAHVLFNKFMTFNPKNPEWLNRDRFVLSYVPSLHRKFALPISAICEQLEMALLSLVSYATTNSRAATVTAACSSMLSSTCSATVSAWTT